MLYLVVYDVDDDAKRYRLVNFLKNMGGERIQYSAFLLETDSEGVIQLIANAKRILSGSRSRLMVLPVCSSDFRKIITVEHNYTPRWMEESPLI